MKKLLMLGGSYFQIPAIQCAKELGYHVITCDYLPENPGHKYSDEYFNISTTDFEGVLALSRKLEIDGISAYASDPAAPTAAYVAGHMGLPTNPFESVVILSRKDLFRNFLRENHFHVPRAGGFDTCREAEAFFEGLKKPVMVKPVDSSGSKGVSKIYSRLELPGAFENALKFSRAKKVVLEEFIRRKGFQIAGDGFVMDGRLVFRCFANEHFNQLCNPLVPIGESFPAVLPDMLQDKIHGEVQRVLDLLGIKMGALNFDIIVDEHDDVYILEIGPRNGGNLIPDVITCAAEKDIIQWTIQTTLDEPCRGLAMGPVLVPHSSYILHATGDGRLIDIVFKEDILENIVDTQIFKSFGEEVRKFDGSNHTIGAMILKFKSVDEMVYKMENMEKYIEIVLA